MAKKRPIIDITPSSIALLYALNAAATQLQGSINSEQEVYTALREQIISLGMRGGISLLDEKGEILEFKVIAQTSIFSNILRSAEDDTGLKAQGYRVPISRVDTYRKMIADCQAQFVPDTSVVSAQVVPPIAQPAVQLLLGALGGPPGIFAPLIRDNKPVGMLKVVGERL